MAARLMRAKATVNVHTPGTEQELQGVSVSVRQNIATVRLGADVILERATVARVVPLGRRSWALHFEGAPDGDTWTVTDERRPCCGRR